MDRIEFCLSRGQMTWKRTAAIWVAAMTLPAIVATVFLVGCCVLPFHGLIHKVLPLCEIAANVMRGEDHHDHGSTQPVPVPEKQQSAKGLGKMLMPIGNVGPALHVLGDTPATTPAAYRSFMTLGAVRCDDDVGTRLAVLDTLRI